MSKVSVCLRTFHEALEANGLEDFSKIFLALKNATRIRERPVSVANIGSAWLSFKETFEDIEDEAVRAFWKYSVDACIAYLFMMKIRSSEANELPVEPLKEVVRTNWDRAIESLMLVEDPNSIMAMK